MKELIIKIGAEEYAAVVALASAARQSPEDWTLSAIRAKQRQAKEDTEAQGEAVREAFSTLRDRLRDGYHDFDSGDFSFEDLLKAVTPSRIATLCGKRGLRLAVNSLIKAGYVRAYIAEWGETRYTTFGCHRWEARDIAHSIMRAYSLSYSDKAYIEQTLYACAPMEEKAALYIEALEKSAADVVTHLHGVRKTKMQKGVLRELLADFLTPYLKRGEIFRLLAFEYYHDGYDLFAPVIAGLLSRGAVVDTRGYYRLPPCL